MTTPDLTVRITEILRGQFPLNGNDVHAHVAALIAEAAEQHYRPTAEEADALYCWSLGPRIGHEDAPVCFEPDGHSGRHRAHPGSGFNEQWGGPARPVLESRRHEFWSPGAGE